MPRNKYPEVTRTRILEAAAKLFWEKGWEETTVQDIVDELKDVTRGAFYHHFQSKDEIINAVVMQMYSGSSVDLIKETDNLKISGLEKIRHLFITSSNVEIQVKFIKAAPSVIRSPIIIGKQVISCIDVIAPHVCRYIEEGNHDGSLNIANPKPASEVLSLLTNLWLNPITFNTSKEEFLEKIMYLQCALNNIGLPVINEEIIFMLENIYDNLIN